MDSSSDTVALIARLKDLKVKICFDNGKLRIEAPKGVVDSTLYQELSDRKNEIIECLSGSNISMHNGRMPLEGVSRSERLPLSFAQERLWFLHQLEQESVAYSLPKNIRFRGRLDKEALSRAFNEIGCRHEALRTTFRALEGHAEQVIMPKPSFTTEVVELNHLPKSERESEALRLAEIESKKPFDLQNGPLFRVVLYCLDDDNHLLHVNMHHMISDYWSFGVLNQEFAALYTAAIGDTPAQLPDLSLQYADYAYWQRQWLQGDVLEMHLNYWRKKLAGVLTTLDLPTDRPRSIVQTHLGATHSLEIPFSLLKDLRALSRGEGVSLFMVLLAVFKLLLYRYTGQEDIILGTPIAGRDRVELEGLIGFFINTIVMRTDLSGAPTFRELLSRVRETALEAYAHQVMPFEKLVEELAPKRDLSRTPIFQIFFNHIRVDERRFALAGLEAEEVSNIEPVSMFDMTLYVWEYADAMRLTALYNTDLFDAGRIKIMLEQFEYLLNQIVRAPDNTIVSYSLLPPSHNEHLPDPSVPLYCRQTDFVHQRISGHAQRNSSQIAVVDTLCQWSYGELEDYSNRLANHLRSNGVSAGDTVAVYGHRSGSLVLALLGILKAGAAFLILDPAYPVNRLIKMLTEADPACWLQLDAAGPLKEGLETYLASAGMRFRLLLSRTSVEMGEVLVNASGTVPELSTSPEDLAYVVFTSGSTGTPKGIIGPHGPLSHFIDWHCREFGFTESDRFSMLSGLAHDPLLRDIFTPLWVGGTLCIPDQETILMPDRFRKWMREHGITVAHMTPALSQILTEGCECSLQSDEELTSLRYVFFGGDTLTDAHVEKVQGVASLVECINFYGTTETPQAMGYLRVDKKVLGGGGSRDRINGPIIPLGRGIEGVQLLLLNTDARLAGIGELGEIHVRTPYLSTGYLNDPELTGERFVSNPYTGDTGDRLYRTGDWGRYRPDGTVVFDGRADRQVTIRGFRVELKEIEACIQEVKNINNCVVVIRENHPGEKWLVAYYVVQENQKVSKADLTEYLRTKLPEYMVPQQFVSLEKIPLTPNGKIDLRQLAEIKVEPIEQFPDELPRTEMELCLAQIWRELLELDTVSVHDNFFDIGGHSLLSIQVITRLEKEIGVRINPGEFTYQTLGQMATSIEKQIGLAATSSYTRIRNKLFNFKLL